MWVLCVGEIVHCKSNFEPDYIGYNAGVGKGLGLECEKHFQKGPVHSVLTL